VSEHLAARLLRDVQKEVDRRTKLLRSVSTAELERAQGHISGLEDAMRVIDEFFRE
jgi:hypothetical protein